MNYLPPLQVIWDYLCLNQQPKKADCIVGFGNFNTDIARRAAELYHMGLYWPDLIFSVTSPQVTIPEYLRRAKEQGVSENASVSVIVGDFQRMDLYAKLGYQLPQEIPESAWNAFHELVVMGFDKQLAK